MWIGLLKQLNLVGNMEKKRTTTKTKFISTGKTKSKSRKENTSSTTTTTYPYDDIKIPNFTEYLAELINKIKEMFRKWL